MIGIDFMTGAIVLSAIRMALFLLASWMVYRIVKKLFYSEEKKSVLYETLVLAMFVLYAVFFSSAASPKVTLDPSKNVQLERYQRNDTTTDIVTPPPRTEKLDGFSPLKKD